ncbi:MAG TPA: hypothetical protein PLQ57_11800 [Saprospiraceae bacterium]|nr:hypothetical protein [Saprospiraceae bacterium]
MANLKIYTITISFVCLTILASSAQDQLRQDSMRSPLVLTAAYFEGTGVILRWAPQSSGDWRLNNYHGYKIERAIKSNSESTLKWEVLASVWKPLSLDEWKKKVAENPTDTMLMVAGQAIHGTAPQQAMTPDNFMSMSDQLTNLHSACLLACEFSREAALASALRFEDNSVLKDNSYVYKLTSLADTTSIALAPAQTSEESYPKIEITDISEGEKAIAFKWNRSYYKNYYSAFHVYRSSDEGLSWQLITPRPVAYVAYKDAEAFTFKDSVQANYIAYQYKVQGLTSFATKGPLSDAVKAMGRDRTAPEAPYDVQLDYLGKGMMKISWMVRDADRDIKGFRISKSNEEQKEFVEITPKMLPGNMRSFIDSTCNENINNYYWIAVFDQENNVNVSMPQYGTIIDSIAPMPPVGLEGTIDTNGVVTVRWRMGIEADLRGYFVHYSNNLRHTFINRTDRPLQDTFWRDTLPLNVLTEQIHYKLVAIDHRFNYSTYSEILTLNKPDKVAPTSPVFQRSFSDKEGISLQWVNSGSHDVKANVLMRRGVGEKDFTEVYRCASRPSSASFTDKKVNPGKEYEYTLYAIDDAGLTSPSISTLTLKAFEDKKLPAPQQFSWQIDTLKRRITLSWKPSSASGKTVVYRSVNGKPYVTYKVVDKETFFTDLPYRRGDIIKYRIKGSDERGWQSDFSEEIEIRTQ